MSLCADLLRRCSTDCSSVPECVELLNRELFGSGEAAAYVEGLLTEAGLAACLLDVCGSSDDGLVRDSIAGVGWLLAALPDLVPPPEMELELDVATLRDCVLSHCCSLGGALEAAGCEVGDGATAAAAAAVALLVSGLGPSLFFNHVASRLPSFSREERRGLFVLVKLCVSDESLEDPQPVLAFVEALVAEYVGGRSALGDGDNGDQVNSSADSYVAAVELADACVAARRGSFTPSLLDAVAATALWGLCPSVPIHSTTTSSICQKLVCETVGGGREAGRLGAIGAVVSARAPGVFKVLLPSLKLAAEPGHEVTQEFFLWLLTHVKHPYLEPAMAIVLPTTLRLLDCHRPPVKAVGLQCLAHVLRELDPSQARWRSELIYEALLPTLHYRDECVMEVSFSTAIVAVCVLEKRPVSSSDKFDEVFRTTFRAAVRDPKLSNRDYYVNALCELITIGGPASSRYLKRLLEWTYELLVGPHAPSRCLGVQLTLTILRSCWARMEGHVVPLFEALCHAYITTTTDGPPLPSVPAVADQVANLVDCVVLLRLCCPAPTARLLDAVKQLERLSPLVSALEAVPEGQLTQSLLAVGGGGGGGS